LKYLIYKKGAFAKSGRKKNPTTFFMF